MRTCGQAILDAIQQSGSSLCFSSQVGVRGVLPILCSSCHRAAGIGIQRSEEQPRSEHTHQPVSGMFSRTGPYHMLGVPSSSRNQYSDLMAWGAPRCKFFQWYPADRIWVEMRCVSNHYKLALAAALPLFLPNHTVGRAHAS